MTLRIENLIENIKYKRYNKIEKSLSFNPKFNVGQKVEVCIDGHIGIGTILSIKHILDWRIGRYTWGYELDFIKELPETIFIHVPEYYITKIKLDKDKEVDMIK